MNGSLRFVVVAAGLSLGVAACADLVSGPTTPRRQITAHREQLSSPQLLVCPNTQSQRVTGVVGLLGGVLSLGPTQIQIPAGAVLTPTLFEIVVPPSPYMEVEIHAVGLASFLFHAPTTVTIDFSRCGDAAPAGAVPLQAVYIDGETHAVLEQMGGVVDPVAHTVTFTTGHLSGYAVAY